MQTPVTTPVSQISASEAKQRCREIPFEVVSSAESTLRSVPLTSGFCVPKGQLTDAGRWLVEGLGGSHYAAQTEVLNRWSDGSVRWLLAHFVAGRVPSGRTSCTLVRPAKRPQSATGSASLQSDGETLTLQLRSAGSHQSPEAKIAISPELRDQHGNAVAMEITDIKREAVGDVRCVYSIRTQLRSAPFVTLLLRLEIWPAAGLVKVETRIRNTRRAQHKGGLWDLGDAGSFLFRGLHLNVTGIYGHNARLHWKAEQDSAVRECSSSEHFQLIQHGSGTAAWANTNHIDARGRTTVASRGYDVRSSSGVHRGYRSEPTVALSADDEQISVAVPEFWQQFPGSLSVCRNTISIGLFPTEPLSAGTHTEIERSAGATRRKTRSASADDSRHRVRGSQPLYELQGGEQKTLATWISTRSMSADPGHLNWVYVQPKVVPSTRWVRECQVLSWLPEGDSEGCTARTRLASYLHDATSGEYSFDARRSRIDEYGWRNFGDVPADHEQTHYNGTNTIISHYNNQFDLVFGGILNLLTSGDTRWFDLFAPLARHVMDIDIYHTSEDRSCFNGGLFWHTDHYVDARTATHRTYSKQNAQGGEAYGGGPSNEHNYTTGLLYYHFLTGSQEAYDSVVSLADWVISMDDGSKTIWGLFDSNNTGLASQTVFEDFHGPGRGAGNSVNALVDAWILTRHDRYLTKAEQLIRRVVHPRQNCDELHLADAEGHWSYTVCLTALGRYLAAKLEAGQTDENYAYVRETLASYGQWMAANEKPSLSEPDRLEYPTEAWAAQDFRKANVLRIAASCTDDAALETAMRKKADELNDAAWNDLYSFGNAHLTARCLSILMTEGLRDAFHRTCRPEYMPPADAQYVWDDWTMFVPQKQRVKSLLKNPLRTIFASAGLLNPWRVAKTIDAVRRQL